MSSKYTPVPFQVVDSAALWELLMALEALAKERRRDGASLTPDGLDMQRGLAELLGPAITRRRGTQPMRNLQDPTTANRGGVITVKDAAATLGITGQAIRKSCASGRLDGFKSNGQWFISADSLKTLADRKGAA